MRRIKSALFNGLVIAMSIGILGGSVAMNAQVTEFSYQGSLSNNGSSANGNYDFEFRFYDAVTGGNLLSTQQKPNVVVTNGVFNVVLDFGQVSPVVNGANLGTADFYLDISVRPANTGNYTLLTPRSKILSTPFATIANVATQAQSSVSAGNAFQLGGVPANQFVQTGDPRMSDARVPLPNSSNYIQNRTTMQTSTNFNIGGDGTVSGTLRGGIVTATTQFNNVNGRLLSKVGVNNLFVGTLAGDADGGQQNTMVGDSAGKENTGNENAMFGFIAGQNSTSGTNNSFFGSRSGIANTTGGNNSIFGAYANLGANNLSNASAFGYRSFVETSNSLVLGGVNGKNGATQDTSVGIGTTTPAATLDIQGQLANSPPNTPNLMLTNYGRFSLIRGRAARGTRTNPNSLQNNDILLTITSDGYTTSGFTDLGMASIFMSATQNWTPTANGTRIQFGTTQNGTTTESVRMTIDQSGNVGIGASADPVEKLDVSGNVRIGTGTTGCVSDRDGTVIAGTCSSDLRFKKQITPFGKMLDRFAGLRPVHYFWRADEFKDKHFGSGQSFGLIAQDVEKFFPELVSTDENGFKMINYTKLPLYTIQAVNDLRSENDDLNQKVDRQQAEINELRQMIDLIRSKISSTGNEPLGLKEQK